MVEATANPEWINPLLVSLIEATHFKGNLTGIYFCIYVMYIYMWLYTYVCILYGFNIALDVDNSWVSEHACKESWHDFEQ